jgi:NTE family protein
MKFCGLVLQGGGALGAYEWGAVKALVTAGYEPKVVTGVSIGAINTAAIAGAPEGKISDSLDALWHTITIPKVPILPADQQFWLSAFRVPGFYGLRTDYIDALNWTSLCDVTPMINTLSTLLDWDRLNDKKLHRVCVTATNVRTGMSARFSNLTTKLTPHHILASGSLPPGFPGTEIDGEIYWDGGLFDNTPLRPLIEMLNHEEISTLPIFVMDLFPNGGSIPFNLNQVKERSMEISFENRFWDDFGGPEGLRDYATMLSEIESSLPAESQVRKRAQFKRMLEYKALSNLHVISAPHQPMSGGMDFSEYTVGIRHETGYAAMTEYLERTGLVEN